MRNNLPPLVSIAVITYNHQKFITTAIKSIIAQDYPNFEIVVADDASSDNTVELVQKLSEKHPEKIRILTTAKNVGPVNNWFQCVTACKGKYVIGLAGDDEFLPGMLSKQVANMEKHPNSAISYADAIVFDVKNNEKLYNLSGKTPSKSGGLKIALEDSIYYSPSIMFKKEFVPKKNIFQNLRSGADLAFYKEIMIIAGEKAEIHYLPEALYKYQKHDANITVTETNYRTEHIEAIIILQKKYPQYKECLNPSIYDFCCVGFLKNLAKFKLQEAMYFLLEGLKAAKYNPLKLFRAALWGVKFYIDNSRIKK